MPATVKFGEYLPDLPSYENPGATVAKNVIPNAIGYLPLPALTTVTDALTARCRGAFAVRDKDSNSYNYAGDATKLYVQSTTTMTDVSRSAGGAYTTATDEFWEFVKWDEQVIATNFNDAPQVITMGGANFAALSGTPPKARHIAIVGQFVVMANLDESGTLNPIKVRWSGINDETAWTASASTQSDSQILQSAAQNGGGWIMRLSGHGNYGLVFQEYSVWRMTYIGSPAVFQFDEIQPGVGTPSRNSVVTVGDLTFFLGQDGFYEIINGTTVVPIGANKVDKTIIADIDSANMEMVIGAADPTRRIVVWIYPDQDGAGIPNKAVIYDWVNKRWTTAEFDSEWIYSGLGAGYTLETLDTLSGSIDALESSLDSREYTGGSLQLSAFETDHKKSVFSGTAMSAMLETPEFQLSAMGEIPADKKALLRGVRPMVDGSNTTLTVQLGTRDNQDDNVSYGSSSSPESDTNIAHFRSTSRYHRVRVNTSGDFNYAVGCEVTASIKGGR